MRVPPRSVRGNPLLFQAMQCSFTHVLRRHCALALLLFLAFSLRPDAAMATVCEPFEPKLTQPGLEQLAARVREMFPERHQAALGAVRVILVGERFDVLELSRGEHGDEIAVSDTYLRSSCGLMLWPMILTPERAELRQFVASTRPSGCPGPADDEATRSCVLGYMSGFAAGWEENLVDRSEVEIQTPLVRQMVLSSFTFALAHEYAHVLIEQPGNAYAALARQDNELAADLQALTIYGSGRAWPVADTLLFAGRREFDALLQPDQVDAVAHDASYCRAMRSAQIRRRLVPGVNAINNWRSRQDTSFILSILPVLVNSFDVAVPQANVACDLAVPAQVTAMVADLTALAEWTARWPATAADQPHAWADLRAMRLRTEPGLAARSGMAVSHGLQPAQAMLDRMLNGSIDAAAAQDWSARLAALDSVAGIAGPMTARDRGKFRAVQAMARFLTRPRGTGIEPALRETIAITQQAFAASQADAVDLLSLATLQLLAGDCRPALEKFNAFAKALQEPLNEMMSAAALANGQDVSEFRKATGEMAGTVAEMERAGLAQEPIERCKAAAPQLRQRLAANLGWAAQPQP